MSRLIDRIDHIVLTVTDIEATTRFYERAFGFDDGPERCCSPSVPADDLAQVVRMHTDL